MEAFDPDSFMDMAIEGSNSTRMLPFPEGEWEATVVNVEAKVVGQDQRPVLNVIWKCEDPAALEQMNREDAATVRQTVWLDLDEHGHLDMSDGSNVSLGRLREAVDQNGAERWTARDLIGARAMIRVSQRSGQDGEKYADVKSVAAV